MEYNIDQIRTKLYGEESLTPEEHATYFGYLLAASGLSPEDVELMLTEEKGNVHGSF